MKQVYKDKERPGHRARPTTDVIDEARVTILNNRRVTYW